MIDNNKEQYIKDFKHKILEFYQGYKKVLLEDVPKELKKEHGDSIDNLIERVANWSFENGYMYALGEKNESINSK